MTDDENFQRGGGVAYGVRCAACGEKVLRILERKPNDNQARELGVAPGVEIRVCLTCWGKVENILPGNTPRRFSRFRRV